MAKNLFHYIIISIFFSVGCTSTSKLIETDMPFQSECLERLIIEEIYAQEIPLPTSPKDEWADTLDERLYYLAVAIGGVDELRLIMEAKAEADREIDLNLLQGILVKLNFASLEVSALAGGLDCEEEKSEQLASFLDKKTRTQERNLTVGAIVTGAAISVISGGILFAGGSDDFIEIVGITGGLVEVWLGLKILRLERKVKIEHKVNVLQMVRDNDNSKGVFPPSIWLYLNAPTEKGESLKELLEKRWLEYHDLPDDEFNVLFSEGGAYTAEMLDTRAELLDQLSAQITLMKQDILRFQRYLMNL